MISAQLIAACCSQLRSMRRRASRKSAPWGGEGVPRGDPFVVAFRFSFRETAVLRSYSFSATILLLLGSGGPVCLLRMWLCACVAQIRCVFPS